MLIGNARWTFLAKAAQAASALALVVILSATLDAGQFGRYAGVVSLVAVVGALAKMGAAELMLERLARSPNEPAAALGRALGTTVAAGAMGFVVSLLIAALLFGDGPVWFVAALAAGELAYLLTLNVALRSLHAQDRFRRAAVLAVAAAGCRVAAAGSLLIVAPSSLTDVGVRFCIAGAIAGAANVAVAVRSVGAVRLDLPTTWHEARRGAAVAVGDTSQIVATRADQILLLQAGLDREAGIYAFGARVVVNALLPIRAVFDALYPDLFRAGGRSPQEVVALMRRAAPLVLGCAVLVGLSLAALGPVVESWLDSTFVDVGIVIVAMAAFPVVRTLQMLVGDSLTGLGDHLVKSRLTIAGAVGNIALNAWWIPMWGWKGAAASTYLTEVGLGVAFAVLLNRRVRVAR